ncbi:flagellar biosynthesis regulator FlaF [Paracoccus sp. M683]|uniref:flagellar biosynthesis regulator FlaF n=1 Tax=Paracoccus sp. M683 TaxID=2594268 RepID=UPI00117CA0A4|nr:flagellar biosynthesis regulator FlaF [Paracoccus sp. M683]TRW96064.1 flagellar biosynthesis regulator FlaF [Paracoccus sp. M683]
MNAVTPHKEYGQYGSAGIRTERDAEYEAFSQVTRLLRAAGNDRYGSNAISAIHKNNELWMTLAADLAQPDNSLPPEMKAGLISLAGFALRHGQTVVNGTGNVEPLIDINVAMMKGLRGEVSA